MSEIFEEYKTFPTLEQAQEYIDVLNNNNLRHVVEKTTPVFDPAFAGNSGNEAVVLKLLSTEFLKANKAFEEAQLIDVEGLDEDYYLFSFTDDELMDVVIKKDEWNAFDFALASKLLKDRGKEVSTEMLEAITRQRNLEMSRHLPYPKTWIIAGYIFSILGGLIGIFIGLQLLWDTKKLPDGSKMYAYDPNVRSHGRFIFLIGLVVLILSIIYSKKEEFDSIFNR